MTQNPDAIVYQLIGDDGFDRLTAAFYARVKTDDILSPMYPEHDLEGARVRLRDFLIFRFGGPQQYIANRGSPQMRARHMPFKIDLAARDRWVSLMEAALAEAALPEAAAGPLRAFFHHMATFMINTGPGGPGNPGLPLRA